MLARYSIIIKIKEGVSQAVRDPCELGKKPSVPSLLHRETADAGNSPFLAEPSKVPIKRGIVVVEAKETILFLPLVVG